MGFGWDLDYRLSLISFGEVKKCGVQHSIQRELTLLEASAIETFGVRWHWIKVGYIHWGNILARLFFLCNISTIIYTSPAKQTIHFVIEQSRNSTLGMFQLWLLSLYIWYMLELNLGSLTLAVPHHISFIRVTFSSSNFQMHDLKNLVNERLIP